MSRLPGDRLAAASPLLDSIIARRDGQAAALGARCARQRGSRRRSAARRRSSFPRGRSTPPRASGCSPRIARPVTARAEWATDRRRRTLNPKPPAIGNAPAMRRRRAGDDVSQDVRRRDRHGDAGVLAAADRRAALERRRVSSRRCTRRRSRSPKAKGSTRRAASSATVSAGLGDGAWRDR